MEPKYFTVPLAIAYWFIPTKSFSSDAMGTYLAFGAMLTVGALTDLSK